MRQTLLRGRACSRRRMNTIKSADEYPDVARPALATKKATETLRQKNTGTSRQKDAGRSRRFVLMRCAIAVVVVCVLMGTCGYVLWDAGCFLPHWIVWHEVDETLDLDGDGSVEHLRLFAGRVSIQTTENDVVCTTNTSWHVSCLQTGDIDHDGAPELVMIVWKRGSYGAHRPFWVKWDDPTFSEHVFIMRYDHGDVHEVWMSSAIGFAVVDAVLDHHALLTLTGPDGTVSQWVWEGWGLTEVTAHP